MTRPPGGAVARAILVAPLVLAFACALGGCKKKISQPQCEQLLDHFAELVVKERYADAGPEAIAAERLRERQEAKNADEFKNCTTAVQANEHECAMKAESSDALIKCLE
ncbi:MAG: hypothetical protein KIS78_34085 [Labilithrix sp.]|nr:hypothetical protein [Labilithrix sp.]MCW5837473.1 hypothetical protein [Labilithrix sp.]